MYREVRDAARRLEETDGHLRAGLLADNTRSIGTESTTAQAIIVEVLTRLKASLAGSQDHDVQTPFVQAAVTALNLAWTNAEKVGLGGNAAEMHDFTLDMKTNTDFARAYLRAALGVEEV